jgi:hypothetical protein
MAKKKVTIEADVQTNAGEASEEFVSLRKQIKETRLEIESLSQAGDMQGLDKAKTKLADLEDAFEKARAQSKEFHDALADMPGPAGAAGKAIQGIDSAFKALIANPIIATIAAIAGIFLALRESLLKTEEGQKKLEKITNSLTKVFNGFIALLEPLAMMLADLINAFLGNEKVMNALAKTAGVLNAAFVIIFTTVKSLASFIGNNLVNSFKTAIGVIANFGKILKGVFTFDLDLIKEGISGAMDTVKTGVNNFVDNVKETGKRISDGFVEGITEGFKNGEEGFKKGYKRLTDAEKEANKKKLEAHKEYLEKRRKQIEDAAKLEEAELKNRMAKELSGVGDELSRIAIEEKFAKQIYEVKRKALQDEAALYSPNSTESKNIKTALLELQTDLINQQSAFSDKRKAIIVKDFETLMKFLEDEYEKEKKLEEKKADDERLNTIFAIQDKIKELDRLNDLRDDDFQKDIDRLEEKKKLLSLQRSTELDNAKLTAKEKSDISQKFADAEANIEKQITAIKKAEQEARYATAFAYANAFSVIGSALQQLAGENKRLAKVGLLIEKAAALASIAISAVKNFGKDGGITSPLAWANLAASGLQAAAVVAATVKGIKDIDAVNTGTANSGPSSVGGGAAMPTFSGGSAPMAPSLGNSQSQTGTLAGIVNNAVQRDNSRDRPIRSYIVQSDITTNQQLDRRLRANARLGG